MALTNKYDEYYYDTGYSGTTFYRDSGTTNTSNPYVNPQDFYFNGVNEGRDKTLLALSPILTKIKMLNDCGMFDDVLPELSKNITDYFKNYKNLDVIAQIIKETEE